MQGRYPFALFSGAGRAGLVLLLTLCLARPAAAQVFPFTSGPIPLCDTSTFTATVSGIGWLVDPTWGWGAYLDNVVLNITTDHPEALQISLTSPEGTTLVLSAFNGAGGQNYTDTDFSYWGGNNITTASAPFTGTYSPQGGNLSVFNDELADGVWTIAVIDTACANGGTGPGGTWTPGWFNGGVGTGAFSFGFASPPPPCIIDMGWQMGTLCSGGSVDVLSYFEDNWWGGMGGVFTVWETFTGTPVADPYAVTSPGQYQVEGSDWSGCYYMGYYEVGLAPAIALGPDQQVQQCGTTGPVDLSALFDLTGATGYSWSLDGVPIPTPTATAAVTPGVYELSATNACSADVAQVTLSMGTVPVLGADQTVSICSGGNVDLTALYSTTGTTAEWSYGGVLFPTPTAAVDPGVYTLLVTTSDGCTDMAEVTLEVGASLALGADQALDVCDNSSLDLTTLYSTTGSTTTWTYNSAPVPTPGTVYQPGTYQLVAETTGGCTDTALVVVTLNLSPNLGADLIDSTCEGEAADLTVFFPTTGLTTSWTLGGIAVPDPSAVVDAGIYRLVATNADGCSDTAYTEIVVDPLPVLGPDQSITECDGALVDLTALYDTGINSTAWTMAGAPVADPTSVTGAGTYTLTVTTASQCTATATVDLAFDPAPDLGPDQAISVCAGGSVDLTNAYTTNGLAAAWTLDGAVVNDPSTVAETGDYQLVVTNGAGCTDTAVVSFVVNAGPSLGADQSFTLCPWQSVDLGAVFPADGLSAVYMLDGQPVADPAMVSDPGTYLITVTDANGCTDEAMATVIDVECMCVADFEHDALCMQDPARFTLVADSTVLGATWDFNGFAAPSAQTDPVVQFTAEGDVRVTLRATLTCGVVTVERTIPVQDCSDLCSVWIPSAFTPDNDAINDRWTWIGECEAEDFTVEVYNRFGEVIFASKDPMDSWDGTYRGVWSPPGVYAYRVGYRLPYQDRKEVMGSITLVR